MVARSREIAFAYHLFQDTVDGVVIVGDLGCLVQLSRQMSGEGSLTFRAGDSPVPCER